LLWHYAFGSGITSEARIGIMSGITVLFLPTPALLEPKVAQQTRVWADFEKGGKRRENEGKIDYLRKVVIYYSINKYLSVLNFIFIVNLSFWLRILWS